MRISLPVLITVLACSPEPSRTGPVAAATASIAAVAPAPPEAAPLPAGSAAPATIATPAVTTMMGASLGATITLRGHPSKIIWQHMTMGVAGKKLAYFDLQDGKEQTVVYWASPPICTGDIEVTGKVVEVRGPPKRPGRQESKVDDSYSERHVDVESTRCVP